MQTNKTCHRINNNKFWAIHPGRLLDPVYRINPVTDIKKNIVRHVEIKYRRRVSNLHVVRARFLGAIKNARYATCDGMF